MDTFDSNSEFSSAAGDASTDEVQTININEEMRGSYLAYAMSVIVARALPDARDGLKPVHRRILFAMHDMGLRPGTAYKKSARLVGEVLGKYHPHGDQAVYDAMARMAQDFSLRYPLVDGQGNFGSQDGDRPAAMRYTEARMATIAGEMLTDINMETVDFTENYDGTQEEPIVLPARLPNLLLNGASGIAVGMATSIPPHNLRELSQAVIHLIDNYAQIDDITVDELMRYVKGPDFPTGASIGIGAELYDELREAYATGRGRVIVRSTCHGEDSRGRAIPIDPDSEDLSEITQIVFTSIPYQANKSAIIERIVSLVREKRIRTIRDLRDESDRSGLRLVVVLKQDAQAIRVLNQLYTFTQLQSAYSINMLALVEGEPRTLGLKRALQIYIEHRYDVLVRRAEYELGQRRARAHILIGLLKAVSIIDRVIHIIRSSADVNAAREELMSELELDEIQASAILDMRLRRLAALEQQKLQDEYDEVQARIEYLEDLLNSPAKLLRLIRADIEDIAQKFGDERRTQLDEGSYNLDEEELYRRENVVISLTEQGYIKRVGARHYRAQRRGGKGVRGMGIKPDDTLLDIFFAHSHDTLFFFSDSGKVYSRRAYEITETRRDRAGKSIHSLLPLEENESITAILPMSDEATAGYVVMATRKGRIKRVAMSEFASVRPSGLIAISLTQDDTLCWVKMTRGSQHIVMVSADGQSIRFRESDVRVMGRQAAGVVGMRLNKGDEIAGMDVLTAEHSHILVVTQNGYGKRTAISLDGGDAGRHEYPLQRRYGLGVRTLKRNRRTGPIIAMRCIRVEDNVMFISKHGVMLISKNGIVLRTRLSEIRETGRNTQGVILMDLDQADEVAGIAIMRDDDGRAAAIDGMPDAGDAVDEGTAEQNGSTPATAAQN